jgi:hypothetical protein
MAMTDADNVTGSAPISGPVEDRIKRADLWEAGADERERLADERERLADERERLADERDALADRHEREVDTREESWSAYPGHDLNDSVELAYAEAALRRAEAGVRRADAQLLRAREAAARLEVRRAAARAERDRMTAADHAATVTDDHDRAWRAERRDFVAAERNRLADCRD